MVDERVLAERGFSSSSALLGSVHLAGLEGTSRIVTDAERGCALWRPNGSPMPTRWGSRRSAMPSRSPLPCSSRCSLCRHAARARPCSCAARRPAARGGRIARDLRARIDGSAPDSSPVGRAARRHDVMASRSRSVPLDLGARRHRVAVRARARTRPPRSSACCSIATRAGGYRCGSRGRVDCNRAASITRDVSFRRDRYSALGGRPGGLAGLRRPPPRPERWRVALGARRGLGARHTAPTIAAPRRRAGIAARRRPLQGGGRPPVDPATPTSS